MTPPINVRDGGGRPGEGLPRSIRNGTSGAFRGGESPRQRGGGGGRGSSSSRGAPGGRGSGSHRENSRPRAPPSRGGSGGGYRQQPPYQSQSQSVHINQSRRSPRHRDRGTQRSGGGPDAGGRPTLRERDFQQHLPGSDRDDSIRVPPPESKGISLDDIPLGWQMDEFPTLPGSHYLNEDVQQQVPLEQRTSEDATSSIGLTLAILRDGKTYVGLLKAFDQFGNLLLDRATQRLTDQYDPRLYSEIYVGLVIVRGENVVLFGSIESPETLEDRVRRLASVSDLQLGGDEGRDVPRLLEEATGAPLQPLLPFAACEEVPLAVILDSQTQWVEEGRVAERRVAEYRRKLAEWEEEFRDDVHLVDPETGELKSVEDAFVSSLLRRAGSPERGGPTVQEVATAKLLFRRWIKATAEAVEALDRRGQEAIEYGHALDA